MRTLSLTLVFASMIFIGAFAASYAQVSDNVVINEVEINPPGDESRAILEWVELYNPTDRDVDIGGWQIASTTTARKTLTLPSGTTIKAGQHAVYSNSILWFPDISAKIQLKDKPGNIIDETPSLNDQKNDFSSWQRKYDGLDTGTTNDWVFRTSNAGSSNGKPDVSSMEGQITVHVMADKKGYVFSETATISGNVSERVYQEKPFFSQQPINIIVSGPGAYQKKIMLYPDLNLEFKTGIKLDKVQGVSEGTYVVSATYGSSQDSTAFAVGDVAEEAVIEQESELSIFTDNTSYIPGQRVKISATTNNILPLEGLKLTIFDAKGRQFYSGTLYPDTKGQFTATAFLTTVNPSYGEYSMVAEYGMQRARTTFEVSADAKDPNRITLETDKKVYGQGEPIVITGRSNKFVAALDIEILQTGSGSIGQTTNIFRIKDQVKLAGDSTFKYDLKVPSGKGTLGDYRVTVSKEFGSSTTTFKIVENPDEFVSSERKNFVTTDKAEYVVGDTVTVSGQIVPKTRSTFEAIPVYVVVEDPAGKPLTIVTKDKNLRVRDQSSVAQYSFTAIPDRVGNYNLQFTLNSASFAPGKYSVKATYGDVMIKTEFTVSAGLDVTNKAIMVSTDKTVYGLGETVKLDGTLVTGQSSVKITLTKPDGKTVEGGSKVDASKFSWSWKIPSKEYETADIRDPKQARPTVFGNYKISIISASQSTDVFFKVSKTPETDTLVIKPLEVSTEKPSYKAGEKLVVVGSAIKRQQTTSTAGTAIPDRVDIQIRTMANKVIYESSVEFDAGGQFKASYALPLTIFKDGKYKVTATYQKIRAETTFEVKNNLPLDSTGKLTLFLITDKEEYSPGETVHVSGSTNKIVALGKLDLVVIPDDSTALSCGNFYCGLGGKKVDISRTYESGIYSYDHPIPTSAPLGTYVVKVDTEFGTFSKTFKVVERKAPEPEPAKPEPAAVPSKDTVSEKFNRITDSEIAVELFSKEIDGMQAAPWSVKGSMTTSRGEEGGVNIQIMADDGQCIIGPGSSCLVTESTKTADSNTVQVTVAGIDYIVEYSGPDRTVEKFVITPVEDVVIPDSVWLVEIVKGDQPSRFYYEIVYKFQ